LNREKERKPDVRLGPTNGEWAKMATRIVIIVWNMMAGDAAVTGLSKKNCTVCDVVELVLW
jgi:hypothetical protein